MFVVRALGSVEKGRSKTSLVLVIVAVAAGVVAAVAGAVTTTPGAAVGLPTVIGLWYRVGNPLKTDTLFQ